MELGCVDYASMKHVKRHVPTRYISKLWGAGNRGDPTSLKNECVP